jgi:hypothetical protein
MCQVHPWTGHKDPLGYRQGLDNLKMFDYVVTPYDDHWEVRPLIDVYFFFFWMVKVCNSANQTLSGMCAQTI